MKPAHALAPLLLALAGCGGAERIAQSAPAPLASEAEIRAAEQAPMDATTAEWNQPMAPFNVIANIYYVGARGVSAWLITTDEGHFLLDGGVPQTAPLVLANIRTLGFDIGEVKLLLNSHAHFDHAGGLAALQRASGAALLASAADKPILEAGRISYGPSATISFPPIRVDRVIGDGETLELGGVALTAHLTAGHTPGCTSWSMDAAGADGARHRVFFHCSATVGGQALAPESYPGMVQDFRDTFARVRRIEADVFLANHGAFFDLEGRRARQLAGDAGAFVDAQALQHYNDAMEAQFNAELARQLAR